MLLCACYFVHVTLCLEQEYAGYNGVKTKVRQGNYGKWVILETCVSSGALRTGASYCTMIYML